jgi:K+-transporting ATPase ATPase C chain
MSQVKRAIMIFLSLSFLCGLVYPLMMTTIAQVLFPHRAGGSLVMMDGRVAGSELIGQTFREHNYFHGRPSATVPAYDASASSGSNLGPTNAKLLEQVKERIEKVRQENGLVSSHAPVPADLVLTSASGLDPHISPASAMLQVQRVARERRLPASEIELLVSRHTERPLLEIWGRERVNVLKLNMALDKLKQERPK